MNKKYTIIILIFLLVITIKTEAGLVLNTRLCHIYEIGKKEILTGKIKLKNTSNQKIKVRLYKRDYTFNFRGENFYKEPATLKRSNATWVKLDRNNVILKAKQKKNVSYRVKIPSRDGLRGTYWSMIMVEEIPLRISVNNDNQVNMYQNVRYGIQVITNFQEKGKLKLHFQDPSFKKLENDQYFFTVNVFNKGITAINSKTRIILVDKASGKVLNKFKQEYARIFPDSSIKVKQKFNLTDKKEYRIIILIGNNERGYNGQKYMVAVDNN